MIGAIRRFGENGVLYEVVRIVDNSSAVIRVLDTGEETTYPITDVQQDPID